MNMNKKLACLIHRQNAASARATTARAEAQRAKAWVNELIELQGLVTTPQARQQHGKNLTAAKTAEYKARQRAIKAENRFVIARYKAEVAVARRIFECK